MAVKGHEHKKLAFKCFELGEPVKVSHYFLNLKNKPIAERNAKRYKQLECNFTGVYAGRRVIHLEGWAEYDYSGYSFMSKTTATVHLVAISQSRTIYVPDVGIAYTDEYLKKVFGDF